jgi:protein gp37
MGDKSAIEWTDATWNPTTGCDRVSPGCAHCYALTIAGRLQAMGVRGYGRDGDPKTSGPGFGLTLHPERLGIPLAWTRPRRIFVDSMSDLFHADVPDGFVMAVWKTMHDAAWHTFQVLTKRPERMAEWVARWADVEGEANDPDRDRTPDGVRAAHPSGRGQLFADMLEQMGPPPDGYQYPRFAWLRYAAAALPNVWLGTSVENARWKSRIDSLRWTPAAVRFLSCEPLLGPLGELDLDGIHWVIAGGESGPDHRPLDLGWVREIRDQCVDAGVAFFFKQVGGRTPKSGGRELDGRTWDDFPVLPERPASPSPSAQRATLRRRRAWGAPDAMSRLARA